MASHSQSRVQSFKATAAMARGLAVKIGADSEHMSVASAATDKIMGISNSAPSAADEMMEVCLQGGGAKGKLGGTVAAGDFLTSDASGKLIATTTENDRLIAMAMEAGAADDLIAVEVILGVS
jgi:hypothetical protein